MSRHSSDASASSRLVCLRRLLPALALLSLGALGHAASASTLTVALDGTGQYVTIQAAINAAHPGDTVLIADGTYSGPGNRDIDFEGKNLTVESENGSDYTVIDCGGSSSTDGSGDHRGFYLHSGETNAVIIDLTIANGYESGNGSSDGFGGGIEVLDASVTVQYCVLLNDTAKYVGGGLYNDHGGVGLFNDTLTGDTAQYGGGLDNYGGGVTLTNDTLRGNSAQDGGGLYNDGGTATLTGCVLQNDTAQTYGGGLQNDGGTVTLDDDTLDFNSAQYGGGLYNDDGGTATLTGCVLQNDTAQTYGGGLQNDGGTVGLSGCALRGNSAQYGGGLYNNGMATLTNDTLTGDTALYGGGLFSQAGTVTLTNDSLSGDTAQYYGGGLYNGGTLTLTNDILYGDAAPNGGEIYNGGGTVSASHCDVAGGLPSGTTDGGGNLSADPKFVNPPAAPQFAPPAVGDAHLRPGSPCLGAGTASGAPAADADGTARPSPPSIGAYEIGSTLTVPAQYATIQAAINAAKTGNTVLLADGTYTGPGDVDLDFGGKNLTVTSVNGLASTIVNCGGFSSSDGSGDHRGFYLHSGETNAVISGLTIANGYESGNGGSDGYGGGIEVFGASVIVQNCVLQNDTVQGGGGGLFNYQGMVTLTNDTLSGNSAMDGGGLFNYQATATLTNCVLQNDTAQNSSGGLYNEGGGVTLTNDTLSGNSAMDGGGLFCEPTVTNSGSVALTNDIFYGDTGGEIGGNGPASASASHCDIAGGLPSGVTDSGGNVNADPLFVSATDLHLQAGSPCLGAGTPADAPTTTIDGRPRPNSPSIGAYEVAASGPATTALSVANVSTSYYQTVTLTATLTAGGAGVSGKTVTFKAGSTTVGTGVTNTSGVATKSFANAGGLAPGSDTFTASFAGDGSDAASSGTGTLTVTKVNATLTVASVSGAAGQTVALSVTLKRSSDGALMANRTLTFLVDGVSVGTAVTNSSGVATRSYAIPSGATVGSHTITVTFPAEANYAASSGTGTLTVTASGPATTTLAVTSVSTAYYQTVTLTATLTAGGAGVSGKTVTFTAGGAMVGTGVTNGSGVATKSYANAGGLAPGSHTLSAAFAGDSTDAASSGAGTLTVTKVNATLTVASVSGAAGQTVALSVTLKRSSDGALMANRTLTFLVDGATAGTGVTNASGVATLGYAIPSGDATGAHAVTVTFPAEANYNASTGTGTLTVAASGPATTTLAVTSVSTAYYQTVTLTATLTAGGAGVSGKTVTFTAGGAMVGTGVTNGSGVATKSYANAGGLAPGSHTLSAAFAGDSTDAASSGAGTLTVTKVNATLIVPSVSGTRGAPVTLSVTLKRSSDGALMANRTLTFLVDGATAGTGVTNASGVATLGYAIPSGDATGAHAVTVTFPAEANYNASSGTGTLTVN